MKSSKCKHCKGDGKYKYRVKVQCLHCEGTGQLKYDDSFIHCRNCNGKGGGYRLEYKICKQCINNKSKL